jgi:polysaccharide deacetylase 2 family uncharacterized protein YibQ
MHVVVPAPAPDAGVRVAPMSRPAPSLADTVLGIAPLPPLSVVADPPAQERPTMIFVIDDMGLAAAPSDRAVALPGPVTLAWLPYAPHLQEQIAAAAAHGHEAMLQMPMEALGRADPGPDALRTWLPPAANLARLRTALDLVPAAVALTQPEGSVASLSVPLMDLTMGEVRARQMAFVDGSAIPHAVAFARAVAAGLPAVARDMTIDGDPDPAAIRARLSDAEDIARKNGRAVLIAHARQTTIDVLEAYLPTLAARGLVLSPVAAPVASVADTGPDNGGRSAAIFPLKPEGAE